MFEILKTSLILNYFEFLRQKSGTIFPIFAQKSNKIQMRHFLVIFIHCVFASSQNKSFRFIVF